MRLNAPPLSAPEAIIARREAKGAMSMPELTTDDGARIYYEVEGAGDPALVFVHGWCSNLRHWDPQAEHFSRRHRVLRVDRRGYGRSPAPEGYAFTPSEKRVT